MTQVMHLQAVNIEDYTPQEEPLVQLDRGEFLTDSWENMTIRQIM